MPIKLGFKKNPLIDKLFTRCFILKKILILLVCYISLFGKVYYAKVEPYELDVISSNVSGEVLYTDENMIGKILGSKPFLKIDSYVDKNELKTIKEKIKLIEETLKLNEQMVANYEALIKRKDENYKRISSLKIKSIVEKDREFYDLVNSENQFLNVEKEIQNLKLKILDLKLRKTYLLRSVKDKTLSAKGFVLYAILVKAGQVVGMATPLAKIADVSKAILTIYLDDIDVKGAKNKVVYIDGKKTPYKISRLLNIADVKNISKYKAQIIIKPPKLFSKLVKIELKDE